MKKIVLSLILSLLPFALLQGAKAAPVVQISIDGPIGPGVASFVTGAIEDAQGRDVGAILLRLDTPGGLDSSMREIIQQILDSSKPVVCFVSPSGARAASADLGFWGRIGEQAAAERHSTHCDPTDVQASQGDLV